MNLVRWEPFGELEEMTRRLNRLFSERALWPRENEETLAAGEWLPPVDIRETEKEYLFKVETPEVKKDDIKVEIENGILKIAGERRQEQQEKGTRYHRIERSYGKFVRSFALPSDADSRTIDAQFKDGLLIIHIGKSEEAKPKRIEVKVA